MITATVMNLATECKPAAARIKGIMARSETKRENSSSSRGSRNIAMQETTGMPATVEMQETASRPETANHQHRNNISNNNVETPEQQEC
jgi:hypothetical protein